MKLLSFLLTALLFTPVPMVLADAAQDVDDGRALAAELRATRPPASFTNRATLRIASPDGSVRRLPVTITTLADADSEWRVIYAAQVGLNVETLTLIRRLAQPPEFEFARAVTNTAAPIPHLVSAEDTQQPFATSDFWLSDLGLEFLHWPSQRLIRKDKPEMRKGRPCRILESSNPAAKNYTRVRSWVDLENKGVILAEAYDAAGKLMKRFSIGSVQKVDGAWQLKDMEMIDEVRGSETRLEFDLKVK
jgi:hypothetical protein